MALKRKFFAILLIVFISGHLAAQIHLAPQSGSDGIPGAVANSFVIIWEQEPDAVDYEYVMSNNRQCFETCPGDTRQHNTGGDTIATEMNLIADRWYYWITRVIYENGEFSDWTAISNFYTKTPEGKGEIAFIAPNPAKDKLLNITIDWATNINARSLTMQILDLNGHQIAAPFQVDKQAGRFQKASFPVFFLPAGVFFLQIAVDENQNDRLILKMIVL